MFPLVLPSQVQYPLSGRRFLARLVAPAQFDTASQLKIKHRALFYWLFIHASIARNPELRNIRVSTYFHSYCWSLDFAYLLISSPLVTSPLSDCQLCATIQSTTSYESSIFLDSAGLSTILLMFLDGMGRLAFSICP